MGECGKDMDKYENVPPLVVSVLLRKLFLTVFQMVNFIRVTVRLRERGKK